VEIEGMGDGRKGVTRQKQGRQRGDLLGRRYRDGKEGQRGERVLGGEDCNKMWRRKYSYTYVRVNRL